MTTAEDPTDGFEEIVLLSEYMTRTIESQGKIVSTRMIRATNGDPWGVEIRYQINVGPALMIKRLNVGTMLMIGRRIQDCHNFPYYTKALFLSEDFEKTEVIEIGSNLNGVIIPGWAYFGVFSPLMRSVLG